MITFKQGDIFESGAQALVNPVNCIGVMGKGLAFKFMKKFPTYCEEYKQECRCGRVKIGITSWMITWLENPKIIVSFPTKEHWKDLSTITYIQKGLGDLRKKIREYGIKSIAIPALGCGCGGLKWSEVKPLFDRYLGDLRDIDIMIYEPLERRGEEMTVTTVKYRDKLIEVCSECKKASCYHGEFMCDEARYAGTELMSRKELDKLKLEHPSRYSNKKLMKVFGQIPIYKDEC